MARLRFIRDLWWMNTGVTDDTGTSSSASYNICRKLNDASGALRFNGNTSSFFTRTIETDVTPEKIRIVCDRSYTGGSQIQLRVKVNNIVVYDETFTSIGANPRTETTVLTPEEIVEVTKNRHSIHYNVVEIEAIYDSPGANLSINNLELHYESDTSATYNNHKSLGTSTTKYVYPKQHSFPTSQYQGNWKNSSDGSGNIEQYIQGPTSSSSTESTYIVCSGEPSLFAYNLWSVPIYSNLEFAINDSGYYTKPTQIERVFLNLRYNQSGSLINAQSDAFNVTVYSNKVDGGETPYMWGPGFGIEPSSSGYLVGTTPLYYVQGSGSDIYYNTSSLIRDSIFKFTGLPSGLQIAAAEVVYYTEPDDILLMHTCSYVSFNSNSEYPSDTHTGKNRFKSTNTNNFFDVGFWQLNPSSIISNTNISGTLAKESVFWHNYYNKKISVYSMHNHCYYNSLFLDGENTITIPNIDLDNDFTVYLHLSASGIGHTISDNGDIFVKYGPTEDIQIQLFTESNNIYLRTLDIFGNDDLRTWSSSSNNQIIITNELSGGFSNLRMYFSDGNEDFVEQSFPIIVNKAYGDGNIVIGSGLTAYLHEFGFASTAINVEEFNKTRHSYESYLHGSGMVLNVPNMSGNMVEDFYIHFDSPSYNSNLYQLHTPMIFSYDTYLTNPSSIRFTVDYENATNSPNGINISGYYLNGYNEVNNQLFVRFYKNLPSGNSVVTFGPNQYENRYVYDSTLMSEDAMNLRFVQQMNNYSLNFKLKSFTVTYDGWYLPATGVGSFTMHTIGINRPSSSLDLYIQNQLGGSGIDFYLKGKEISNNSVNFHTLSSVLSSGYFNFTTDGKYIDTGSINLYMSGLTPPVDTESVDMIIRGLLIGDYDVYNEVYNPPYFPIYFYSGGGSDQGGMFGTFNMYIGSDIDPLSSINMFIGSSIEETEDSINLFIDGSITSDKHVNMFLHNIHSGEFYDFTMFMQVPQSGLTSNINMYINNSSGLLGPEPDPGFIFLIDQDSEQLIDQDGEYLQELI